MYSRTGAIQKHIKSMVVKEFEPSVMDEKEEIIIVHPISE